MSFWRSVFSESDGNGSFGRVAFGFVIFVSMILLGFIVWAILFRHSTLDLRSVLEGFAWFMISVGTATYGANKVSTLAWGDKKIDSGPPKP